MTAPPPPPPYGQPPGGPGGGPGPGNQGGQPPGNMGGPPPGNRGGPPPAYGPPGYPPPPPLPYPDGYIPPPPPKGSSGKWWLIGGAAVAIIVVMIVVFLALVVFSSGNKTATDVAVGDCLSEIPTGDRVVRVKTIGCDQPHAGEVFAVLTMPGGDFPGQAAVEAYHERCGPELARYSPAAMADDSVQLYVLYPTADTWSDGDRAVTCIATLNPPRTGSIRG